ncbi:MAG: carboxymuconolactone decarboxylase family protein [Chloroflexi bacterium]|nr:carboxymuconolactone decarboxylase family protein [Chloroflexota bacterium]
MSQLPKPYQQFSQDHPDVYKAYENLGEITANSGPLDIKTRELIKLGMATAAKSESAVQSHTFRALEAGANVAEIEHAIMLGINTLGFSTMMAALTWARQAISKRSG